MTDHRAPTNSRSEANKGSSATEARHQDPTSIVLHRVAAVFDGDETFELGNADIQHLVAFSEYLASWLHHDGVEPRRFATLEEFFEALRQEGIC